MDERSKNIDILFRNGLKEFEVLPPSRVWENITPSLVKRENSFNVYRLAAMIAILVSLSAAAIWLTRSISGEFYGPALSLNQEMTPEGSYAPAASLRTAVISKPIVISANEQGVAKIAEEPVINDVVSSVSFSSDVITSPEIETRLGRNLNVPSKSAVKNSPSFEINKVLSVSTVKPSSVKLNYWSIIAMASPDYYSKIYGSDQVASQLAKSEKSALSYSGGMGFSYKVGKRVSVQSGVIYSSIGQKVTGISSFSGFVNYNTAKGSAFSVLTSNGVIVATNPDIFLQDNKSGRVISQYTSSSFDPSKNNLNYLNSSVTQNFNYLEIPVMLKYKALDRKIDLNFIGGLSYNMLVGNSVVASVNGERIPIGKTEGLNTINFSSSVGLGLEYNLSGKVSLNVEPTFRYYLTPFGNISGSSVHPYAFGVLSGLSYKF